MKNFFSKAHGKLAMLFTSMFVLASNVLAAEGDSKLTLPTDAKDTLTDIIQTNFSTVIGVVIIVVAAGLLIKLIRKVG